MQERAPPTKSDKNTTGSDDDNYDDGVAESIVHALVDYLAKELVKKFPDGAWPGRGFVVPLDLETFSTVSYIFVG